MAFLYIDRLKSDFQRVDHSCMPRTNIRRKWCPQAVIKRLSSQKFDNYYMSEQLEAKNISINFAPKVPKIITIGLRLDPKDTNDYSACRFWKDLLRQYLNFIRRYQRYLHISWQNNGDQWNVLSFTFFKSMISRCSKKFKGKCSSTQKSDCIMLHCEDERSSLRVLQDFQSSTRSSSKLKQSDDINGRQWNTLVGASKETNSGYRSQCISSTNQTKAISKKNAAIQTLDRGKFSRRRSKNISEDDQKENIEYISTNMSSSQDIKTLFTTNRANFDSEKSKTNLEVLGTRYIKENTARKHKSKKSGKKSKKHDDDSSKNFNKKSRNHESTSMNAEKDKNKTKKSKKSKKVDTAKNANINTNSLMNNESVTLIEDENWLLVANNKENCNRVKDYQIHQDCQNYDSYRNYESYENYDAYENFENYGKNVKNRGKIAVENSVVIRSNVNLSENLLEDKSSEVMILGNVKKRLEEDYDDYFSVNDVDLNNDLFLDAQDTCDILEISEPLEEIEINHCASVSRDRGTKENLETPLNSMLMAASVTKHQEISQESAKQSIKRCSLTCTSSFRFSNSDLGDQECSPSSSIEYCTARNISISKFHDTPSHNNSFNALLQAYSLNANVIYDDGDLRTSERKNRFSKEASFKTKNVFEDSKEFFDRALVNSYTVCCYQRNSTPNLSHSTKQITESLDSGILTDYSRDHLKTLSNERFGNKIREKHEKWQKCYAEEVELLPTYDFNTDSSYSDDSLNRRVDVVVKKFTEDLILTERRARTKLKRMENSVKHRQRRKRRKSRRRINKVAECIPKGSSTCKFESSPRLNDDDWIISSSTPPFFSFSDSEMDHL